MNPPDVEDIIADMEREAELLEVAELICPEAVEGEEVARAAGCLMLEAVTVIVGGAVGWALTADTVAAQCASGAEPLMSFFIAQVARGCNN